MKHEWITITKPREFKICCWCGLSKNKHKYTECKSKSKIITSGDKPKVIYR